MVSILLLLFIFVLSQAVTISTKPSLAPTPTPTKRPVLPPSVEDVVLTSFTLDMFYAQIILGFDRFVDAPTFDISRILIQGKKNLDVSPSNASYSDYAISFSYFYGLTALDAQGNRSDTINIYLTSGQFAQMILMKHASSSIATTYVSLTRGAILSAYGRPNVAINSTNAFRATSYIRDSLTPYLLRFTVDMDAGTMTLLFSEPVNLDTFTTLGLAAQIQGNTLSSGAYVTLYSTGSYVISSDNYQRNVTIALGSSNINAITANLGLWTSASTTWLSGYLSFVQDVSGNKISLAAFDRIQAMRATHYVMDVTPPTLLYWDLDYNVGSITLYFSETVFASYFNISCVVIASAASITNTSFRMRIQNPTSKSSVNSYAFSIFLNTAQFNLIRLSDFVARYENYTYLSLDRGAVVDMSDAQNLYQGLDATGTAARRVRTLSGDVTRPQLVRAAIDMSLQTFSLTFTEIVSISSLSINLMTLQSSRSATTVTETAVNLITKVDLVTTANALTFVFKMKPTLFYQLKTSNYLAKSLNTTYVTMTKAFVTDVGVPSNQVIPISTGAGKQFSGYVPDLVAPTLTSWYMDMDNSQLRLTFSEPVDVLNMNVTKLLVRSEVYDSPSTLSVQLTSGSYAFLASGSYLEVIVQMSVTDANRIKSAPPLCTSLSRCLLSFDSRFATDTTTIANSGEIIANPVAAVSAVYSSNNYKPDQTAPILLSFSLDMSTGVVKMVFDEPVIFVDSSRITFYSGPSRASFETLGAFSKADGSRSVNITLNLCREDFVKLKKNPDICTSDVNSFMGVLSGMVVDMNNNPMNTLSLIAATSVFVDKVAPALESFHFNATSGNLTAVFDDVIDVNLIALSNMELVGSNGATVSLGKGAVRSPVNSNVVLINTLSLASSLTKASIGATQTSTFMYLSNSRAVQDIPNHLPSVRSTAAKAIREGNTVLSFWFSLEDNSLMLELSYHIPIASLAASGFVLNSLLSNTLVVLTNFSDYQYVSDQFLYISLSTTDIIAISKTVFFSVRGDVTLSLTAEAIIDTEGNQLSGPQVVKCSYLNVKKQSPSLKSFNLNLGTGVLELTFSDPILVSSVRLSSIRLASGQQANSTFLSLSQSKITTDTVAGIVITISLNSAYYPSDRELIIEGNSIATSSSSLFLFADSGFASDVATPPNYLSAITINNATRVSTFTPDRQPPQLLSYNLDLSLRKLYLFFDESMKIRSCKPTYFTLAQSTSDPLAAKRKLLYSNTSLTESYGRYVVINIGSIDFDAIMYLAPDLCLTPSTCFLSIIGGAITDSARVGNGILDLFYRFGMKVTNYTQNSIPPAISAYDVSVQDGFMDIYFDNVIYCPSLKLSYFMFQQLKFVGTNGLTYRLDNSSTFVCSGRNIKFVKITFGVDNLVVIKSISTLLKSKSSTFLYLNQGAFADVAGNLNVALEDGNTFPARLFYPDTVAPTLLSFTVSAQALLTLTFDEPVDFSTLSIVEISFQDRVPTFVKSYALRVASFFAADTYKMKLQISLGQDYFRITTDSTIFTKQTTTYLRITSSTISDTTGNRVNEVLTKDALIMGPTLKNWEINMNINTMYVYFSEAVNSSFSPSGMSIQTSPDGLSGSKVVLTTKRRVVAMDSLGTSFYAKLSDRDANLLKFSSVANSISRSYLAVPFAQTASTFVGSIVPFLKSTTILETAALRARKYAPDITVPQCLSFDLQLNPPGLLTIKFDKPVVAASLVLNSVILLSKTYGNFVTIKSGTVTNQNLTNLQINLTSTVLDEIKVSYIEGALDGLIIGQNGVVDFYNNPFPGNFEYSAIPISRIYPDITPPVVQSSILDVGKGLLTIVYNEAINTGSCKAFNLLILSASTVASSLHSMTLTNYSYISVISARSVRIDLSLFGYDNLVLHSKTQLAQSLSNSYVDFKYVTDLFGNSVGDAVVFQVTQLIADVVPPELLSFSIMNSSSYYFSVELAFSDLMKYSTFNCSNFVFSTSRSTAAAQILILQNSYCSLKTTSDSNILLFHANKTYFPSQLAAHNFNSSFISIPRVSSMTDISGNVLSSVQMSKALTSGTHVVRYLVDMVTGSVTLIFSTAVVRTGDFDATQVGFYSTVTGQSMQLTNSSVLKSLFASSPVNDTVAVIKLSADDLINFKSIYPQDGMLYLLLGERVLKDVRGIWLSSSSQSDEFKPSLFIADTVRPILRSVTIDMSLELLKLVLDEPIQANSIKLTNFRLQSNRTSLAISLKLTGGVTVVNKNIVTIYFSKADMATIKLTPGLATSNATSYLSFAFSALVDIAGNSLRSVPFSNGYQITTYIADTKAPELQSYTLNMNLGIITFFFSEPVLASSLDMTAALVQNSFFSGIGVQFRFTGGTTLGPSSDAISVQLLLADVNQIKLIDTLARTRQLTYIVLSSAFASDMFGNTIASVIDGAAMPVNTFIRDSTPPFIVSYSLNADGFYFIFEMSEPVVQTTVDSSALTVATNRNGTISYQLSRFSRPASLEISFTVKLQLSSLDINSMKSLYPLITSASTTWISFEGNLMQDTFGNKMNPVSPASALRPSAYVLDTTKPLVLSYELDMNAMAIRLSFTESISLASLNLSQVVLQNCPVQRFCNYTNLVTSSTTFLIDSTTAMLTLTIPEKLANFIKYNNIGLTPTTSQLSWSDLFAFDYSGNNLPPVWDGSVLNSHPLLPTTLIADETSPVLTNWFIDRDLLHLHLRFSEPIYLANITTVHLFAGRTSRSASPLGTYFVSEEVGLVYENLNTELIINFKRVCLNVSTSATCVVHDFKQELRNIMKVPSQQLYLKMESGGFLDIAVIPNPSAEVVELFVEGGPVCGQCPTGSYASTNCTISKDEVCSSCSKCPSGMFQYDSCSLYSDTQCGECSTCGVGTYISTKCSGASNTVCSPCTKCSNLEYEAQECTLGRNTVCNTCKQCFFSDAGVRKLCNNDRYWWWANSNCCFDKLGGQVQCNLLDRQNMMIYSRNGRHHWAFVNNDVSYQKSSPAVDGSQYTFGKTW